MKDSILCIGNVSTDIIKNNEEILKRQGGPVFYISKVLIEKQIPHELISKVSKNFNFDSSEYLNLQNIQKIEGDLIINIDLNNPSNTFIKDYPGKIDLSIIEKKDIKNKYIIISTIFEDITLEDIKKLKSRGAIIVLDIQGFMRELSNENKVLRKKIRLDYLKFVDILKLNNSEFNLLFEGNMSDLISAIKKYKIKEVILSKNKSGTYFYEAPNQNFKFINANSLDNIDNTGAGDMLLAKFIANKILGFSPFESINEAQNYVADKLIKRKNEVNNAENEI